MKGKTRQTIQRFLSPTATPGAGSNFSANPIGGSRSTSPVPSESSNAPEAVDSSLSTLPHPSTSNMTKNKQKRALEVASSFQTLLTIVEKTLDGCPIWGPKAVVGAAVEVLRITRLKKDNDDAIMSIQREAESVLSMTSEQEVSIELAGTSVTVPAELQDRIEKFKAEIEGHLHDLDAYRMTKALSQASKLSDKIKEWLAAGAEVLTADAISKTLPEVNRKISVSIQNFILVGQIRNEAIGHATFHQVTTIAGDVKAIGETLNKLALPSIGFAGPQDIPPTTHEEHILLRLYPIKTASHDAEGAPRACHAGTREAVLHQVETWFRDPKTPSVLWLSGIAGTGKTAIAQSICELLEPELGASFLFSRDFAERRRPSSVLPTIAYQLAYSRPTLRSTICKMLSKDPNFASKSVRVQAQELLFRTLGSELTPDSPVTLLVLDALDECDKENGQEGGDVIPLLLRFLRTYPSRFKVVITSRPETSIRAILESGSDETDLFVLHEVDRNMVQSDIAAYLNYELGQMATKLGLSDSVWPASLREEQVKELAVLADRLFIFAATIVKALSKSPSPSKIIRTFLDNISQPKKSLHGPLDAMYLQVVQAIIPVNLDEQEAQDLVESFQSIVGAILTLEQPMRLTSLRQLLNVEDDQLHAVIRPLYAVLDMDDSFQRPIQIFHLSFPDFLTDDTRCTDPRFHILRKRSHYKLSVGCLRIINDKLERDICRIGDPSLLNAEIEDLADRCENYTSVELRYACLYWWAHLEHFESVTEELVEELKAFTSERLLQWMELLSVMGQLRSALVGLPKAIEWCKRNMLASSLDVSKTQGYRARAMGFISNKYPGLTAWHKSNKKAEEKLWPNQDLTDVISLLYDASRVTQAFFFPISESALQVYESALTFMPNCFLSSHSDKLRSQQVSMPSHCQSQSWSQELRVMEGHKDQVIQVVVSPNGSLLASCSSDETTMLWDIASGTSLICLDSYSNCLIFSADSSRLLSSAEGSDLLKTWDVVSGELLQTIRLRSDGNQPIVWDSNNACKAISPSCNHVAISLDSGDLFVLGVDGSSTQLQGHASLLNSIVFSLDGSRIVSGSDDETARVWDTQRQLCVATFRTRSGFGVIKAFLSSDGCRVVGLAGRKARFTYQVYVWDIETRQKLLAWRLEDDIHPSSPVSMNETSLVCLPMSTNTLIARDISTGQLLSRYEGHTGNVWTTAFVPDGLCIVSGSADSTIRVWDAQLDNATASTSEKHNNRDIWDLVLSADGTKLITVTDDNTVRWRDTRSGQTLSKISKSADKVGFSAGVLVALAFKGSTINVWNAETGKAITTLRGHSHDVNDAAFSPDFTRLASHSADRTVRIWNTATWDCTAVLTGHTHDVDCVCFSPDGSRIVSGSFDTIVRMWDAVTGDTLAVLEGHAHPVSSVRFSSDSLSVVSRQYGGHEREWKAGVDFPLPSSPSPLPPVELDESGWLFMAATTTHRRRLCWLPLERRGILRFSGHTIALGSAKGVVTILSLPLEI